MNVAGCDLNDARFGKRPQHGFASMELGCATFTPGGASPAPAKDGGGLALIAPTRARRGGLAKARRLHLPLAMSRCTASENPGGRFGKNLLA